MMQHLMVHCAISTLLSCKKILTRNANLDSIADMKRLTTMLLLALCFFGAALCFAGDSLMGTWKLNEMKSKFAKGATKNNTVVYEAAGDSVKVTTDGSDKDGKSTHSEWTGNFDTKDYPVTGDSNSDAMSYKTVDDRHFDFEVKNGGKVTTIGHIMVSADGKTRTVRTEATDSAGKKISTTAVYDKQ